MIVCARLSSLSVFICWFAVLGNFVSALNEFVADRYSSYHSVSEYHVYEFFKVPYLSIVLRIVWHLWILVFFTFDNTEYN